MAPPKKSRVSRPRRSLPKKSRVVRPRRSPPKKSRVALPRRSPPSSISRPPKGLKLLSIKKSTKPDKKLMAEFSDGTVTHFGAFGMSDFTRHKDPERKKRYIIRHKKRENWKDPRTAGALSLFILWNKETVKASVQDFKGRFKL